MQFSTLALGLALNTFLAAAAPSNLPRSVVNDYDLPYQCRENTDCYYLLQITDSCPYSNPDSFSDGYWRDCLCSNRDFQSRANWCSNCVVEAGKEGGDIAKLTTLCDN